MLCLDIMKITRHYISGLEEKSLKNPSLTSIIDEPEIILNVLQDNLKANEKEFINNLQKLFEDCNIIFLIKWLFQFMYLNRFE